MPANMTFSPVIAPLPVGEYTTVIGAGGLLTGMQGSSSGKLIARLDTNVAHTLGANATQWQRATIPGISIASADVDITYGTNVYAVAVAWNNDQVEYQVTMGDTFVKKPGASTFTKTAVPRQTNLDANDRTYRMCGNPIDVNPTDSSIALVGFPSGAYRLTNHGDTATPISTSSLPLPIDPRMRYIFRWSYTVANRVWAFVPGYGLYRSNDGGVNWTKITDAPVSPTAASHMKAHPTADIVMLAGTNADGIDAQVRIWNNTTSSWSVGTRTDGGGAANLFAIEYSRVNPGRVYGVEGGGAFRVSLNDGSTWDDLVSLQVPDGNQDIRWHAKTYLYFTASEIIEHPVTGNLRMSAGVGCFEIRNPPSNTVEGTPIQIFGLSKGIENMVATCPIIAPNGDRCLTMQDKQGMIFSPNGIGQVFPRYYGPVADIGYATGADYAPEDTNFWAVSFKQLIGENARGHGWTPDRGKTWTLNESLPNQTGGNGWGDIALLSKDVAIAIQGMFDVDGNGTNGYAEMATNKVQNGVWVTRNFRAATPTWTQLMIGNNNAVFGGQFVSVPRKCFVKHPYEANTVYFYNPGDMEATSGQRLTDHQACIGVYKIVDTGSSFTVTRVRSTRVYGFAREAYTFKFVHGGAANRLLICAGTDSEGAYRSTDGGVTFPELTGTDNLGIGTMFAEVYGIAAGAPHPSNPTVPTLWAIGFRGNSHFVNDKKNFSGYGLWESRNDGVFWTRRAQFPGGYLNPVNDLGASMHRYGDLTLTTPGQGACQLIMAA